MFIKTTLRLDHNFDFFVLFFFAKITTSPLGDCHYDLTVNLANGETLAIIFPRGFGKTTFTKAFVIRQVVYYLDPVILYVCDTLTSAKQHFESIKSEFENNELLRQIFGDLTPVDKKGSKWTNTHFETTNGVNVVARGAGKGRGVNIKNSRPTLIILDDIEDDELVRSQERLIKLKHWITNVIIPSRDPIRGRIKWIGTILSPFAALVEFYNTYGGVKRGALEDEYGNPSLTGKPIWPQGRSKEWLMSEKEKIGTSAFSQEYLNLPVNTETQTFKEEMFKYYDVEMLPSECRFYTTVDLAISKKDYADSTAIVTVGVANDNRKYIVRITNKKLNPSEVIEEIKEHWRLFNPVVIGVEAVAYQQSLLHFLRLDMQRNVYTMPLKEIKTREDKQQKIRGLEPFFERGEILMLPEHDILRHQLYNFPLNDHDDVIDALAMQIDLWNAPQRNYNAFAVPKPKPLTVKEVMERDGLTMKRR